MRVYRYPIHREDQGRMIKEFLRQRGYSTRAMARLKKEADGILLNGTHARTVDLLQEGDLLCITFREDAPPVIPGGEMVPILYEDGDLLVFDKPSGMAIHPCRAWQGRTLAHVFAAHMAQQGEACAFRALNRLDRDTTGTVLVAKNQYVAGVLAGNFQKEYVGVVQGILEPDQGTVDAPIAREAPDRMKRTVSPEGQPSVTHYRVLERGTDCTLVVFHLETGRTHQIRVHMAHLGHPLAGDPLYGGDRSLLERQALHCRWVRFQHPVTGQLLQVCSPLPRDILVLFPRGSQLLEAYEHQLAGEEMAQLKG